MNYWLFKSEPDEFSIDDLKEQGRTNWEGVRNYQARNFMRDECKNGDLILFYHSSCKPAGVAGIGVVSQESFHDPSQFSKESPYFDPKSSKDNPRWQCVEISFKKKFPNLIPLAQIKENPKLSNMTLTQKGSRLSIQKVKKEEFEEIKRMAGLE